MATIKPTHTMCDKVDTDTFGQVRLEELVHLLRAFLDRAGTVGDVSIRSRHDGGKKSRSSDGDSPFDAYDDDLGTHAIAEDVED